jgi:hypothetical protein
LRIGTTPTLSPRSPAVSIPTPLLASYTAPNTPKTRPRDEQGDVDRQ